MKNERLSLNSLNRCLYCGRGITGFTLDEQITSGITVCRTCGGLSVLDSPDKPLRLMNESERLKLKDHSQRDQIKTYHDRIVADMWG